MEWNGKKEKDSLLPGEILKIQNLQVQKTKRSFLKIQNQTL
ncbi:hypothetical protein LEP1GSC115_5248 [Leptospira interrogans serovar Australis str. 200703203]|uniref:Uncharacterized protein n=1 Tax=Leptospira interrogans serovar Australis str. 200703203 TaxID=1085541 RepID=N1US37_LEPIR|nr:hypothetical protein LEP1GSC115_5248 [Leptospira interrogans serovar Australis str. 200703203]